MKHKECLAKIKADKPDIKHMDAFKLVNGKKTRQPHYTGKAAGEISSSPHLNPVSGRRSPVEQRCQESTCQDYGQEESTQRKDC
jgi:hypothetical protein